MVTAIVGALRALLGRRPVGDDIRTAPARRAGIPVVAYLAAMAVHRRPLS